MDSFVRVECMSCGNQYYILEDELPQERAAILDAAFPSKCPFCEDGYYAVLAVSNEPKGRK